MALKNYTSEGRRTFDKISKILAIHGVTKLMYEYNPDGTLSGLTFAMMVGDQEVGFRMPAMVENVIEIMYGGKKNNGKYRVITQAMRDQAYRTAWANIRDWIDAQMALIDTKQAKVEQVFLPYLIMKDNKTLYERIRDSEFKLLN